MDGKNNFNIPVKFSFVALGYYKSRYHFYKGNSS